MRTPKTLITIAFALFLSFPLTAQSGDEAAVKAVIANLFKGMEKGDSALVHKSFANSVTMASIFRDKNANPVIRHEPSIAEFLVAVGTAHKEVWYEEVWNLSVKIDGDFAQAWCDYAFYVDKTFSHCGVDALHLHKEKDGWKIFHLADTRRKDGCNIPKEIEAKHK